jgi:hypothetical protein
MKINTTNYLFHALQDDQGHSSLSHGSGSEVGSFLGWAMAIIYMGGRLPQIFLNVSHHKKGTFFLL